MKKLVIKIALEIADDLFETTQALAKREKTSFGALAEQGLRMVLKEKLHEKSKRLTPLITFDGTGPTEEFKDWNWAKIQEEIYRGHGS